MLRITKNKVGEGINSLFYLDVEVDGTLIDDSSPLVDSILIQVGLDRDDLLESMILNQELIVDKNIEL